MLRAFDTITGNAPAGTLVVAGTERAVLRGGGLGYAMPWHWHDCLMLLLPSRGALDLRCEARREGTWVTEDRFAVVPAEHPHETLALREGQVHVAVYVTEAAIRRVEADLGCLDRIRSETRASALFPLTPGIRALQALCCDRDADADPLASAAEREHLAAALLIRCLAAIERARPLPAATSQGHGAALVDEVRAFVEARPDRTVSLDALADRFDVSRRHLTRLFRERVGLSVGAFQQARRLAAATELLIRTHLPVGEAALRTGFESGSALARSLRRQDGRSPTEIRTASVAMARSAAR